MYVQLFYLPIHILEHARASHTYMVCADTGDIMDFPQSPPTGYW